MLFRRNNRLENSSASSGVIASRAADPVVSYVPYRSWKLARISSQTDEGCTQISFQL